MGVAEVLVLVEPWAVLPTVAVVPVEVEGLLYRGHPEVVDADLADYFGSIPCGQKIGTAGRTCSSGSLPKRLTWDNGVASVFRDFPIAAAESGLWMKPWACDQAAS